LWLDGDKGVTLNTDGTTAKTWDDQSGNFNNGRGECSGPYGPAVLSSALHGHNAMKLGSSGSNCGFVINDAASLQFGTGPFAVIAVVQQNSSTSLAAENLYVKQGPTAGAGLFVTADSNVNATTPSAAAHAFMPSTGYHVVVIRGPALEARVDGSSSKGSTSSDDVSYPGSYVLIGYNDGRELDLAEMVAVKGSLSDDQVVGIENYMKAKYGLTF
jgi:hypothetical protein